MDQALVTQLGVGGIFVILVLRMLLEFLGKTKRNGSSGDRDPEYWKAEFRNATRDVLEEKVLPSLDRIERREK
jgi:hypothetical protein